MHQWAIAVERIGGRIDEDLKSGFGPPRILEWLESIAHAMAIDDAGGVVDATHIERIGRLRREAEPYLAGGGSS